MSMNNVIPAWTLGEFDTQFNKMKNKEITIREFYDRIRELPEVPQPVKANWLVSSEEYTYFDEIDYETN